MFKCVTSELKRYFTSPGEMCCDLILVCTPGSEQLPYISLPRVFLPHLTTT